MGSGPGEPSVARVERLERGIFAKGKRAGGRMTAMPSWDDLFKGRHFGRGIIVLRARWRLRYKLGCRNLVEMMAEPDVSRSYDHHALRPASCSGVRKCGGTASRGKFADRGAPTRPTTNQGASDISLPRSGQGRKDRGFPPSRLARCRRRRGVFSLGVQEPGSTAAKDRARGLSSFASGCS